MKNILLSFSLPLASFMTASPLGKSSPFLALQPLCRATCDDDVSFKCLIYTAFMSVFKGRWMQMTVDEALCDVWRGDGGGKHRENFSWAGHNKWSGWAL